MEFADKTINPDYRLKDLGNGLFQIHSKNYGAFEGTPGTICKKVVSMGVKETELSRAVNRMSRDSSTMADFDANGNLLVTWKRVSK